MLRKTKLTAAALALAAMTPLTARAGTFTTLCNFQSGTDGATPQAALIVHGGLLYGTTTYGGTANLGTAFSVNPKSGAETQLHSFQGGNDGATVSAGLTYHRGALYGTTSLGGASSLGTLFRIDPLSGQESIVHTFSGGADGATPMGVTAHTGYLYGAVNGDGSAKNSGAIFDFSIKSGTSQTIYAFSGPVHDGAHPVSPPADAHGKLYGTTFDGGSNGEGTVYEYDRKTGVESLLHNFEAALDGAFPNDTPLYQGRYLYVTTTCFGPGNNFCNGPNLLAKGTLVQIDPKTGNTVLLHAFESNFNNAQDGEYPMSSPTFYNGAIYGTTSGGDTPGGATIYTIDLATGAYSIVYTFPTYSYPSAGLTLYNGAFYGTTAAGGTAGYGTVYKFVP